MRWMYGACSTLALLAMATPAAVAQTASDDALDEVVVTAQKGARAESLQRVPVAITAIDVDALEESQITTIADVARLMPNAQFGQAGTYAGYPNFFIRGIGNNSSQRTVEPAVGVVVDGMPYAFGFGMIADTFDLGQVEILRGPQGVLQGRNATGGVISLTTRRPSDTFGFEAEARLGNGGRFDQSFLVEGPLAPNLRGKIAVMHRYEEGLFEDNNGGTQVVSTYNPSGVDNSSQEDQPQLDDWIIRPILQWDVNDALQLTFTAEFVDMNDGGGTSRLRYANPGGALISPTGYGWTPQEFGNSINHGLSPSGQPEFGNTEAERAVLQADWDVGPGIITSITGYRTVEYEGSFDNDGTPYPLLHSEGTDASDQVSQELRFASDFSETLRFVTGVYWSESSIDSVFQTARFVTTTNTRSLSQGISFQDATTWALFANVDWTILEGLTLSAGARYTHEDKEVTATLVGACAAAPAAPYTSCPSSFFTLSDSWNDTSPRIALSYQANDNLLVYASWTTGFKGGAYNVRSATLAGFGPVDPESVTSTEIGLKSTFLDGRARLNLAAFTQDYQDIQRVVSLPGGISTLFNAAAATINGAELEASFRPGGGWQLDAAIGWLDAGYDEFPLAATAGVTMPIDQLKFDRVPEWTVTLGASYDFTLASVPGDFSARTTYSWRDDQFADIPNRPEVALPAYGTWDLSLSYEPNANWGVQLYGRNLTDENYWDIGVFNTSAILNTGPSLYGGSPRSYGVELSYRY